MSAIGAKPTFLAWALSIWWSILVGVFAQEAAPSNATTDLLPDTTRFLLEPAPRSDIKTAPTLHIVPLTGDVATMNPQDFLGNIKASDVVRYAKENEPVPVSIVLWSAVANHCRLSNPSYLNYDPIFTTIAPVDANRTSQLIANDTPPDGWSILPDTSATPPNNGSRGGGGGNNAMIILYSITGIITALFLVIIVTGAIRAHRHPERYGPRNIVGRPRQSRARGIARAMLETLPIVRFGDQEEQRPKQIGEGDVELAENRRPEDHANNHGARTETSPDSETRDTTGTTETNKPDSAAAAVAAASPPATVPHQQHGDGTGEDGTLGCSICTEDFTPGEHVRVLPCNHKFHPACVDPWLLDVSGTCPLCRVDLRPPGSSNPTSPTSETHDNLPPPLTEQASNTAALAGTGPPPNTSNRRHTLRTGAANALHRLRDMGPEERIAALRNLRRNRRSTMVVSSSTVDQSGGEGERSPARRPQEQTSTTQLRQEVEDESSREEPAIESNDAAAATRTWRERMRGLTRR